MTHVTTISEAGQKVRDIFGEGLAGTAYFILEQNRKEYQIRVSDHAANSNNNTMGYDGFFSFISSWNLQHSNMANEWKLDEDGDFTEEFINVEECLDWNIN